LDLPVPDSDKVSRQQTAKNKEISPDSNEDLDNSKNKGI